MNAFILCRQSFNFTPIGLFCLKKKEITTMNLNDRNRIQAWKYFWPEGQGKAKPGYCLHHKDPSWKTEDPERYSEWRPEDLVMMEKSEHSRFHNLGNHYGLGYKHTEEAKQKIRIASTGENNGFFSHHHSEETKAILSKKSRSYRHTEEAKKKMSEFHKGRHFTEEHKANLRVAVKEAMKGMKMWNNGIINTQAKECPRRRMGERYAPYTLSKEYW